MWGGEVGAGMAPTSEKSHPYFHCLNPQGGGLSLQTQDPQVSDKVTGGPGPGLGGEAYTTPQSTSASDLPSRKDPGPHWRPGP